MSNSLVAALFFFASIFFFSLIFFLGVLYERIKWNKLIEKGIIPKPPIKK